MNLLFWRLCVLSVACCVISLAFVVPAQMLLIHLLSNKKSEWKCWSQLSHSMFSHVRSVNLCAFHLTLLVFWVV